MATCVTPSLPMVAAMEAGTVEMMLAPALARRELTALLDTAAGGTMTVCVTVVGLCEVMEAWAAAPAQAICCFWQSATLKLAPAPVTNEANWMEQAAAQAWLKVTKVWLAPDTLKPVPAALGLTAGQMPPRADWKTKKLICCTMMVVDDWITVCVTGGADRDNTRTNKQNTVLRMVWLLPLTFCVSVTT